MATLWYILWSLPLQVDRLYRAGDMEGARNASKRAEHYSVVALRIVFLLYASLVLLLVAAVLIGFFYGIDYMRGLH